jgi:hypothetical protein
MSRAGVPQNAIAAAIQATSVNFDVSPRGLIALNAGGVDGAVIALMINASTREKFAASFGVATGSGWTRYQLELPVPAGATNINFGLLLTGTGTAWFDALGIELDGAPWNDPLKGSIWISNQPRAKDSIRAGTDTK